MDRSVSDSKPTTTRRTFLLGAAAAGSALLAGCVGDEDVPEPVTLGDPSDQTCDWCDMVIAQHPGPKGQAFFDEDVPADRDGPAAFCSTPCTYNFVLDEEDRGNDPTVIYGTDYSAVDWDLTEDDGAAVITAHLEADDFADVEDLAMVAGSDVEGSMGGSIVGFSSDGDAEAFADEHGGALVTHEQIDRNLLAGLGD